jgi:membrane protein DedA with SNARE-associated domain
MAGMDFVQLIRDYGPVFYVITFVWTFLEGETFVLFAATAAAQGVLDPVWLYGAAWGGTFLGDQCWFYVGRRYGWRFLVTRPRMKLGVDRAVDLLRRFDLWFILSFRFIYGIRNVASFAMGMSGMRWRRFLILNFIAAGLWATTFVGIGYVFGQALDAVLADGIKTVMVALLGVFICVVAVVWYVTSRRRCRVEGVAVAPVASGGDELP